MLDRAADRNQFASYVFTVLAISSLALMTFVSRDYAISTDEPIQSEYGRVAYAYFRSGLSDRTALHYREEGVGAVPQHGALFDLICAVAEKLSPLGRFPTRHLVNSIVGWIGMLYVARIAGLLAGPKASCLAIIFLLLSPRYFGDSMNNPKDIPFASAYVASAYYVLCARPEFPFFSPATLFKTALAIGAAIEIRAGGIILLGYLWAALFGRAVLARIRTAGEWITLAVCGLVTSALAILAGVAFWPWAQQKPFLRPFQALKILSNYQIAGNFRVLFDGTYYRADGLPSLYIPTWIAITVPVMVLVCGSLSVLLIGTVKRETALRMSFLWLVFLFPILSAEVMRPVLYDGLRHLLFVVPPFVALAAFAAATLWDRTEKPVLTAAFLAALALASWDPLRFSIVNHPLQITYFNPLIGGVRGAFGRYDIDYWANSYGPAMKWLEENLPPDRPIRVTGVKHPTKDVVPTYAEESSRIQYAGWFRAPDADVYLDMTFGNASAIAKVLATGHVLHVIGVDDVPLCLIKAGPAWKRG